jgi:hypothetical protein
MEQYVGIFGFSFSFFLTLAYPSEQQPCDMIEAIHMPAPSQGSQELNGLALGCCCYLLLFLLTSAILADAFTVAAVEAVTFSLKGQDFPQLMSRRMLLVSPGLNSLVGGRPFPRLLILTQTHTHTHTTHTRHT